MSRGSLNDDDIAIPFEATQEARHAAMSRLKKRREGAIPARVEALAQGGEA